MVLADANAVCADLGVTTFSVDELNRLPGEVLANLEEYGGSYAVYVIMGRKP